MAVETLDQSQQKEADKKKERAKKLAENMARKFLGQTPEPVDDGDSKTKSVFDRGSDDDDKDAKKDENKEKKKKSLTDKAKEDADAKKVDDEIKEEKKKNRRAVAKNKVGDIMSQQTAERKNKSRGSVDDEKAEKKKLETQKLKEIRKIKELRTKLHEKETELAGLAGKSSTADRTLRNQVEQQTETLRNQIDNSSENLGVTGVEWDAATTTARLLIKADPGGVKDNNIYLKEDGTLVDGKGAAVASWPTDVDKGTFDAKIDKLDKKIKGKDLKDITHEELVDLIDEIDNKSEDEQKQIIRLVIIKLRLEASRLPTGEGPGNEAALKDLIPAELQSIIDHLAPPDTNAMVGEAWKDYDPATTDPIKQKVILETEMYFLIDEGKTPQDALAAVVEKYKKHGYTMAHPEVKAILAEIDKYELAQGQRSEVEMALKVFDRLPPTPPDTWEDAVENIVDILVYDPQQVSAQMILVRSIEENLKHDTVFMALPNKDEMLKKIQETNEYLAEKFAQDLAEEILNRGFDKNNNMFTDVVKEMRMLIPVPPATVDVDKLPKHLQVLHKYAETSPRISLANLQYDARYLSRMNGVNTIVLLRPELTKQIYRQVVSEYGTNAIKDPTELTKILTTLQNEGVLGSAEVSHILARLDTTTMESEAKMMGDAEKTEDMASEIKSIAADFEARVLAGEFDHLFVGPNAKQQKEAFIRNIEIQALLAEYQTRQLGSKWTEISLWMSEASARISWHWAANKGKYQLLLIFIAMSAGGAGLAGAGGATMLEGALAGGVIGLGTDAVLAGTDWVKGKLGAPSYYEKERAKLQAEQEYNDKHLDRITHAQKRLPIAQALYVYELASKGKYTEEEIKARMRVAKIPESNYERYATAQGVLDSITGTKELANAA